MGKVTAWITSLIKLQRSDGTVIDPATSQDVGGVRDAIAAFTQPTTPADTQPVSAASLPLPSGAATESTTSSLNERVGPATSSPAVPGGEGSVNAHLRRATLQLSNLDDKTPSLIDGRQPVDVVFPGTQMVDLADDANRIIGKVLLRQGSEDVGASNRLPTDAKLIDPAGAPYTTTNPLPVNVQGMTVETLNVSFESLRPSVPPFDTVFGANETRSSDPLLIKDFAGAGVLVQTDQTSAVNGAQVQFSDDGLTWTNPVAATIPANVRSFFYVPREGSYIRFTYTNGPVAQTSLHVSVIFSHVALTPSILPLGATRTDINTGAMQQAHNFGRSSTGQWLPIAATSTGDLKVQAQSESLIKKTIIAAASGDTTLYTPASGKRVRLYFFGYSAGSNVEGVLVGLKLVGYNAGAVFDNQYLIAPGQPYARNIQGGKRYIEGGIDGALSVNLNSAQTVYCNIEVEEVG